MAFIKIRGRLEAIQVDDARARKIKERKFGVEGIVAKAEPNELIDLGDWSGEYGRIVEIEMSRKPEENTKREMEERAEMTKNEHWFATPAKVKARSLEWFKLCYSARTKEWRWEPDAETSVKATSIQEKWFTENPRSFTTPPKEYGDLLPPRGGKTLAQSKQVERPFDDLAF